MSYVQYPCRIEILNPTVRPHRQRIGRIDDCNITLLKGGQWAHRGVKGFPWEQMCSAPFQALNFPQVRLFAVCDFGIGEDNTAIRWPSPDIFDADLSVWQSSFNIGHQTNRPCGYVGTKLSYGGFTGDLIRLKHSFGCLARVFDRLQRGVQGALNKPNANARNYDGRNSRNEHKQGIQSHVLLSLQVSICALLVALGVCVCRAGYSRGGVGDERSLRFVLASVGMVISGGLLASFALTASILLLR
jgi:hypothetical protein